MSVATGENARRNANELHNKQQPPVTRLADSCLAILSGDPEFLNSLGSFVVETTFAVRDSFGRRIVFTNDAPSVGLNAGTRIKGCTVLIASFRLSTSMQRACQWKQRRLDYEQRPTSKLAKDSIFFHTEAMHEPIYTPSSCQAAYQLRWSFALFAEQRLSPSHEWLEPLKRSDERDAVRVLENQSQGIIQLFRLSPRPDVAPPQIVKSVKGRLQNLIQVRVPQAFRRNFRLTSVGDAKREKVEAYVAGQLGHHRMADQRVDPTLADFQIDFPEVDLSRPQRSAHGEYLYNLHLVLVHAERWQEVRRDRLQITLDMIVRCARTKRHRLSRVGLLVISITLRSRMG